MIHSLVLNQNKDKVVGGLNITTDLRESSAMLSLSYFHVMRRTNDGSD